MPAMPEPSAKVSASTHGVLMPIDEAMRRLAVTARICRPQGVRFMTKSSRKKTASEKASIQSRFQVTDNSPMSNAPDIHDGLPTS